jgi:DNA-binding HxlR family transcriptional regulator
MEWSEASTHNCPVGIALDLLGEKWTLLIVRDALNGVRRFDAFRQHMGLSEAVLSDRLRKLVDAGVLYTRSYQEPGQRERYEYLLTDKGRDLLPVVVALKQWSETHYPDPAGPVIQVLHKGCDGEVRVALRCEQHKHARLGMRDTVVALGPGARAQRRGAGAG